MLGLMQDRPLLISSLIEFAALYHGKTEIVSRSVEGPVHRYTYRDLANRSKQLANALTRLGVKLGDRIGTLAWNTYRHFELYYGVSGMGAVLHTVNPRLFPEQIDYIVNHAEDSYLFFDLTFLPLVEKLAGQLKTVKGFVLLTDRAHMPKESSIPNLICYEELIGAESTEFAWPEFDERTASSLCYTSGTTGNPKGVLYSHRSTVLHSYAVCQRDGLNLGSGDSALVIVPLFHANAWGVPYGAAMCGAKLVFPGPALDGKSVYELLRDEKCNFSLGVPTVWLAFFQYVDANPALDTKADIKLERCVIGGSAAPRAMIERFAKQFGCFVIHAWGMTEMSPLGTTGNLLKKHADLPVDKRVDVQSKQGRTVYGVDIKITDDEGRELPRDGVAFGNVKVRGPWITAGYFKSEGGSVLDADGYFTTGDVATLDGDGYMQITDRAKDVIKSGGEWISSIDLENAAVGHPAVQEAAVIGVFHAKWQERPLLLVIKKPGQEVSKDELLSFLESKIAKWWMPDDVVFVTELPHTATGKLLKTKLREQFKDHKLPTPGA
ncbi:3-(methylthio)propionyl-CoA ligase [Ferrovibrio sp.]|uniref:3-(methylthio)propionyl-CoA ligase n=1 Tax=Ferrovibrio sp. TaxID=1917215 RepID=UPI001B4C3E21|nr:3-(methylthio)propionyl-CoA ligase [Ferrovibrio sp.]MBP7064347.1 long-chain-fatty-acid--CoA ligase [Ferrovibrio sp.]